MKHQVRVYFNGNLKLYIEDQIRVYLWSNLGSVVRLSLETAQGLDEVLCQGLYSFLIIIDSTLLPEIKLSHILTGGNQSLEPLRLLLDVRQVLVAGLCNQEVVLDSARGQRQFASISHRYLPDTSNIPVLIKHG